MHLIEMNGRKVVDVNLITDGKSYIIDFDALERAASSERFKGYRDAPNSLGIEASRLAYTHCEKWLDECIEVIHDNSIFSTNS